MVSARVRMRLNVRVRAKVMANVSDREGEG
jgi:hypothetical protein